MVGAFLMLLDVLTQDLGLRPSSHFTRMGTGLLVGWSASAFLLASLATPKNN